MNLKITLGSFAGLVLVACAAQAAQQVGDASPGGAQTDAVPAVPPPQRGGPGPMPKPVVLSDRPGATGGEKAYVEKCAMCHAVNGMGYGLLARRVGQPDLEKRDNLAAAYVIVAARRGIGNMPAIPRGEVSDAELRQIADYLAAGPHGEVK